MSDVYGLSRRLIAQNGTCCLVPICSSSDEKVVDEREAFEQKWLAEIAQTKIMADTAQGPRVVMSMMNFLAMIGIHDVGTIRSKTPLQESNLIRPIAPKLVLP